MINVAEIIGWNLYFGWYHDTFADFGKFIDEQHERLPNKSLIINGYGANADTRLHSVNPKRIDSTIERQKMFLEAYLPQINARKFIAGSAIWNQFDFGSEFRGEMIPHFNQKGLFTYDRKPKDTAYFYKAHFADDAVLHIAARDWKYRSGTPKQTIDVYTNLQSVELFQNGVWIGKESVGENRKSLCEVDLQSGKNSFVANGLKNADLLSDSTEVYFNFDVPDGFYEIELRFVELKFKENGQRIFDVSVNNQTVLKSFDLANESGFIQFLTKKFRISAENDQGVKIGLQAIKDKPVLSGVKVKRIL